MMLRITPSYASGGAKRYFDEALSRGDYYMEGQEIVGSWGGRAASMLGLSGEVSREEFHRLCDNLRPDTGEKLTARMREGRRVGYDFNFHCPKNVSSVYALTGDRRIEDAFRQSVRETMRELEADTECRVRDNGQNGSRRTGNMVWAEFTHLTSRPVDGVPDPHLHAHCFAFNATWDADYRKRDGTLGMWKAGDFGGIKRDARYFEAAFHSRFSRRVAEMGYGIKRDGKGFWDIAAIPDSVKEKFSRRTHEIEELAKELGIDDPDRKAQLGATSRGAKAKGSTRTALRRQWDERLTDEERESIHSSAGNADGTPHIPEVDTGQALEYSRCHLFERKSAVPVRQLAEYGLRHGFGAVTVGDVWRGIDARKADRSVIAAEIEDREFCTTRQVLAEEREMIASARSGRGTCEPLGSPAYRFRDPLFSDSSKDTAEQERAIREVLASRDLVTAVRGRAGTGKTTLMREVADGIAETGGKLFSFAPTAQASRGVMRTEGFAGADTVARLLVDTELQERIRGQVIWIDEAGLLGAGSMNSVLRLASRQNCRVILSGDTRQHAPVERGDALRVLEERGGVQPVEITRIHRQRVHSGREPASVRQYREAVKALSEGEAGKGFDLLDRMEAITIFDIDMEPSERHSVLAQDYVKALQERNLSGKPKTVLAVSPTHVEADAVTAHIRAKMKEEGRIGETDREVTRLVNLNMTGAQKGDAASYQSGQVIQFNQNAAGGFIRGERFRVSDFRSETGEIQVTGEDSSTRSLPLAVASRFSVYEEKGLSLAPGDRIRVTKNGFTPDRHRLNNGALYTVKAITDRGNLRLDNGWEVNSGYGHIAHGYCTTSHSSQGKTVDEVLIAQSGTSFSASSIEQFYVSVSRGRERVRIYTDDKEGLRNAVARSGVRISASDVANARPRDDLRERRRRRDRIRQNLRRRTIDRGKHHERDYDRVQ